MFVIVEQIGAKIAIILHFVDEELKFGAVTKEATKSKTGYRANIYQS